MAVVSAIIGGVIATGIGIANLVAAHRAQDRQIAAGDRANDMIRATNQQAIARQQPYTEAGLGALGQLQRGIAAGDFTQAPMDYKEPTFNFEQDPGYNFRLQQGKAAIQNSAAARGGLLSGATLKALNTYGQGQAAQEYGAAYGRYATDRNFGYNAAATRWNQGNMGKQQQYSSLASMANMGQNAAAGQGQMGIGMGNNLADIALQQGNVQAAGAMGVGNAISGAIQGIGNSVNTGINQWQQANPAGVQPQIQGPTFSYSNMPAYNNLNILGQQAQKSNMPWGPLNEVSAANAAYWQ